MAAFGIARYLSLDEFGYYSFINAFVSSIMFISFFGTGRLLIREVSLNKERAPDFVGISLVIRFCLILAASVAVLFFTFGMELSNSVFIAVLLAMAIYTFQSYTQLLTSLFQAFEKMKYETMINLVSSILLLAALLVVMLFNLGFLAVFLAIAFGGFVRAGLASWVLYRYFVVPRFDFTIKELIAFIKDSALVGIGMFLYMNLFRVDVLLLKWLKGVEEVAYFQGVHNIIIQTEVLPAAVMAALFPRMSRLSSKNDKTLEAIYQSGFKYIFLTGLTIAIVFFCYSEQVIRILLGEKFLPSVILLKILSWSVIALFVDIVANSMFIALGKQHVPIIAGTIAIIANVVIGILLIPKIGQQGAAVAALLSYMILFVICYIFLSKIWDHTSLLKVMFKSLFVGIVTIVVIQLSIRFSLIGSFVIGATLFVFMINRLGILPNEEIRELLMKTKSGKRQRMEG